jgi:hypothetical protein
VIFTTEKTQKTGKSSGHFLPATKARLSPEVSERIEGACGADYATVEQE